MRTFVSDQSGEIRSTRQFATFFVDGNLYGIDVMKVQEVTKSLDVTKMKTAPAFIRGLINLRGQIATAIDVRELFALQGNCDTEMMTVICKVDDVLLSLLVDRIGDVVEVSDQSFEKTPQTVPGNIKVFMGGVYKQEGKILSIINLDFLVKELATRCA